MANMTWAEMADRISRAGNNWAEPDAMRWWRTRVSRSTITCVEDDADQGRQVWRFVSSEQDSGGAWGGQRRYSVRQVTFCTATRKDGRECERVHIGTVGEFGAYSSRTSAVRHLLDWRPVYEANNRCRVCYEHITDPHSSSCAYADRQDRTC